MVALLTVCVIRIVVPVRARRQLAMAVSSRLSLHLHLLKEGDVGDKGWKRAERMMARDVAEERIPVTGERAGRDFGSRGPFGYQLKVRRMLPKWLFEWLDGICANAARYGQIGVLVLNRPRRPRRHAVVVLRWKDGVGLHGHAGLPPDRTDLGEGSNPDARGGDDRGGPDA